MKMIQILPIIASIIILTSCAQKDSDKIGDAQACLDKAKNSSQANTCITKVEGINSASADGIRCAGKFIGEGFSDPQKYITALNNLSGGGGITGLMGALSFSSQNDITVDTDNAETTFGYCANSGGKGATLLAVFAYLNNAIYEFIRTGSSNGACATTPVSGGYSFASCLSADAMNVLPNMIQLVDMAATSGSSAYNIQSALGAAILTTYNISCEGGSISSEMCTTLGNSVTGGAGNNRQMFKSFLCTLAPSTTGC